MEEKPNVCVFISIKIIVVIIIIFLSANVYVIPFLTSRVTVNESGTVVATPGCERKLYSAARCQNVQQRQCRRIFWGKLCISASVKGKIG